MFHVYVLWFMSVLFPCSHMIPDHVSCYVYKGSWFVFERILYVKRSQHLLRLFWGRFHIYFLLYPRQKFAWPKSNLFKMCLKNDGFSFMNHAPRFFKQIWDR